MTALLDGARRATYRISAKRAPFDAKGKLKARGYRWNGEASLGPHAWSIEVEAEQVELELQFLEQEVFFGAAEIPIAKVTAFERFSATQY
ncbi:hypothetical protein GCM10009093_11560 [Brevundimonas terrae]|uniref:CYTH domain-containing protein n=2 Tax=Brevundimonas terrae TaxID=363631 RepID=A0ABP3I0W2_9CAUL